MDREKKVRVENIIVVSSKKDYSGCMILFTTSLLFRKMPINASGMDFTHKCQHFPNPIVDGMNLSWITHYIYVKFT